MSEISFPIEFTVAGTPVSMQAKNPRSKEEWKQRILDSVKTKLPEMYFASESEISVTIYHFPDGPMISDIDNIVKPFLDSMTAHVYIDDSQVSRIVAQKFEQERIIEFSNPSETLSLALSLTRPVSFVRISDDPIGDRNDYLP